MKVTMACRRAAALALVLLLVWALPAAAEELIGRLAAKVGPVTVIRASGSSALQQGDALYQIDQLLTGPESRARIELVDGAVVAIGADTELAISEYLIDDEGQRMSGLFDLLRGNLRATVTGGPDAGNFDIRTRIAVASTRAADSVIELSEEKVSVYVIEGQLQMTGYQDGVSKLLESGFGSDTKAGLRVGDPRPWSEEQLGDLLARTRIP